MALSFIVYNGRNNTLDIVLKAKAPSDPAPVAQDLSAVSEMALMFPDGQSIIDTEPTAFPLKWSFDSDEEETGKVSMRLGTMGSSSGLDEILAGSYEEVRLVVKDATNPKGVTWDTLSLEFVDEYA